MNHMDHSAHGHAAATTTGMDMPGMPSDMCSMNMLFTWNTKSLCIVFRWWHVRSTTSLLISLLAVVAFSAGYEALREGIRRFERLQAQRSEAIPNRDYRDDPDAETASPPATGQIQAAAAKRGHIIKAVLYGLQNFYAFMIMLIFMTYNGWVMIAVSVGAFVGYLVFGDSTTATKETACH